MKILGYKLMQDRILFYLPEGKIGRIQFNECSGFVYKLNGSPYSMETHKGLFVGLDHNGNGWFIQNHPVTKQAVLSTVKASHLTRSIREADPFTDADLSERLKKGLQHLIRNESYSLLQPCKHGVVKEFETNSISVVMNPWETESGGRLAS